MGVMPVSRVRVVFLVCLVGLGIAGAFQLLPLLVEPLVTNVGVVLARRDPPAQSGWPMAIQDVPSPSGADRPAHPPYFRHALFGEALSSRSRQSCARC
jgi:hypothetical protein